MSFEENLSALALKVAKSRDVVGTEEATKTAFILPFIRNVLGYDVFDPEEVIPEFTADMGTKKGEKIDYAILHGNQVEILIEAKSINAKLRFEHASQLFRYFSTTRARIAILTNGEKYNIYTDLDYPNRMDENPFISIDLQDITPEAVAVLKKISKHEFALDALLEDAEELKYVKALRDNIAQEFREPSDALVSALASKVYAGRFTQKAKEKFTALVKDSLKAHINEAVDARLQIALLQGESNELEEDESDYDGIITTEEELEGVRAIKAVVAPSVDPERIVYRDYKTYMSIFLDGERSKPLVRLYFNTRNKKIALLNSQKEFEFYSINAIDEIYNYSDEIRARIRLYDAEVLKPESVTEELAPMVHEESQDAAPAIEEPSLTPVIFPSRETPITFQNPFQR